MNSNCCDCSTAKSNIPPTDTFSHTQLTVQSMDLHQAWPPVIKNWFQFSNQESSPGFESGSTTLPILPRADVVTPFRFLHQF